MAAKPEAAIRTLRVCTTLLLTLVEVNSFNPKAFGNSPSSPLPEENPLAKISCGSRPPVFKVDFQHLAIDNKINPDFVGDTFELTAVDSVTGGTHGSHVSKYTGSPLTAPNVKGDMVPDVLEPYFVLIRDQDGTVINTKPYINSIVMDAKLTSNTINISDAQTKRYLDYLANASPASSSIGAYNNTTGDGNPIPTLVYLTVAETIIAPKIIDAATNPTGKSVPTKYEIGNKRRVGVWQMFMCFPSSQDLDHVVMGIPVPLNQDAIRQADFYTYSTEFYTTLPLYTHTVDINKTFVLPPKKKPFGPTTNVEPNVLPINNLVGAFGNVYTEPCPCGN